MNEKEVEWSDVSLTINGVLSTVKFRGFEYGRRLEKEPLHAGGNETISIQTGNETYSGSFTFLKGMVDVLDRAVRLAGGKDILDAEFLITVAYRPRGTRILHTDTLYGVQFSENIRSMVQNAKYQEVSLPVMYLSQISIP